MNILTPSHRLGVAAANIPTAPPPPWTLADLASPPVSLFDAIDLAETYANDATVGSHTDSAGLAFVPEGAGLGPYMKYATTPNGAPSVLIGPSGSGKSMGWKSSTDMTLGRWTMFALWKRSSATDGVLSSYLSQHGANVYGTGGGYLWAGGDGFVMNRRGTTRSYKSLTSAPADPLDTWCLLSCGCEPGVGIWGKINGVSITATDATDTGGGTTSVVGDYAAYDAEFSGPLFRGAQFISGIDPRGYLAFEIWLPYSADSTELDKIATYINNRFLI